MSRLLKHLLACAAALSLAVAAAWGAVEINELQVTNVGTTTLTVVWTTSEVSTPALEVFSDSAGANAVTATLGLDYYPIAEGDPAVVNESGARAGRRALELLAINRRVVVVRVTGLSPGTAYYVRPRTFGPTGTDNGVSPVALKPVTTALFTSMVVDGRLLRVRFPGFAGEGMVALVQGPAGTAPLSAIIGDSTEADSAVFPLAGLLDITSGTNALYDAAQPMAIRVLGSGAPAGTFTRTVDFTSTFKTAQLDTLISDLASPAPIFTTQPLPAAVTVGLNATFTVAATGTPTPTYKWQRQPSGSATWSDLVNDATYSGVSTATLSVMSATLAMTGDQFRCLATNGLPPDATSNAATLTVSVAQIAASFTTQPLPAGVTVGLNATFTVAATGTPTPTYKWQRQPSGSATWSDLVNDATYSGVATATLSVTSATLAMTGDQFRCLATNGLPPDATSNAATLTVSAAPPPIKVAQSITFGALSAKTFGGATFTLSATASSGLPVSYASSTLSVATVSGNTVTIVGAGTTTITASQDGDATYLAATAVPQTLVISKATQTITFAALASKLTSDLPFTLGATASSTLAVSYASSTLSVATVSGNTVTIVGPGTTTLTATQPGDTNFNAAPAVPQVLVVNPIAPVITSPLTVRGVAGLAFNYTIQTNLTPAAFSSDTLPAGLTLNAVTGVISGTPLLSATSNVTITAQNGTGFDSRTLAITIQDPPPRITSALAASGQVGSTFAYTIVAENTPTSYAATALAPGLSVNTATGAITGTPTQAGTFIATITATNAGGSTSQSLVLTFAPAPSAPVYSGNLNPGGTQGISFSFTPVFSGSPTTFALSAGTLPAGLTLQPSTGVITGSPSEVGTFAITLRATNAGGSTDVALQITINPAPAAPIISSANAVSTTVGAAFSFPLTASGVPTVYTFTANNRPAWLNLNPATGVLSGTPVQGSFTLQVHASNSPSAGVVTVGPESVLVITVNASPFAPAITNTPVVVGRVGVPLNFQLTTLPAASSFAITSSSPPAWITLDPPTGAIGGTPTAAGPTRVVFAASDPTFGQGRGLEVLFDIAPALLAPVITSGSTMQGQIGQQFRYVITTENGPITGYAMPTGTLPAGLAFDAALGVIEGIPSVSLSSLVALDDAAATAPVTVSLTATNAAGTSDAKSLQILILPPTRAPVIMSPLEATARVGSAFSYQIVASGGSPVAYFALNLPLGLSCDTATGLIGGTPTVAGNYPVTLRANVTGAGLSGPFTLSLIVLPRLDAPRITSLPAKSGNVGSYFEYSIVAEPGPILNYNVSPALPLGLTLNTATGVISGRPTEAATFVVNLTATNSTGTSVAQPLAISITTASGTPIITSPRNDLATVGTPYTYRITAANLTDTRPLAPPNSLGVAPDSASRVYSPLPPGLAVNPAMGVIEGTPTAVGEYEVSLAGTNAAGMGAVRELTILVRPALTAPTISSPPSAAGQVGTAFAYTITATNSPWMFGVRDAPPWMMVNNVSGTLSGTPTTPGVFVVRPFARNSAGFSDAATLTLIIAPTAATPIITSTRTASGRLRTSFVYTITATPAANFFVATGLPAGLTINGVTGVISGAPTASGTYTVILTAVNAAGVGAPATLSIKIQSTLRLMPDR